MMYAIAVPIFFFGAALLLMEDHAHTHSHDALTHEHFHRHDDGHHTHEHSDLPVSAHHTHRHTHEPVQHSHPHWPDIHHRPRRFSFTTWIAEK
jgi:hypothetical protein